MKKIITLLVLFTIVSSLLIYSYKQDSINYDKEDKQVNIATGKLHESKEQKKKDLQELANEFEKNKETNSKKDKENKGNEQKKGEGSSQIKDDIKVNEEDKSDSLTSNKAKQKHKVKIEYTESTEQLTFQRTTKNNPDLNRGVNRVVQEGKHGVVKIKRKYQIENNVRTMLEENREIITKPTHEIVEVGTKAIIVSQGSYNSQMAKSTLQIVNDIRSKNGLSPVEWNNSHENSANIRSKEIKDNFSHTRPNGQPWYTVSEMLRAENIAYGQRTSHAVIDAFMNSPMHRENILNPEWTSMGVSVYVIDNTHYWVQLFS